MRTKQSNSRRNKRNIVSKTELKVSERFRKTLQLVTNVSDEMLLDIFNTRKIEGYSERLSSTDLRAVQYEFARRKNEEIQSIPQP